MTAATPSAFLALSLQPSRPVGQVVALACEDIMAANGIAALASLIDFVGALSCPTSSPQAGNRTPFMTRKVKVVTELNLCGFVVGFQALKDNLLRRRVRLIPIKLLSPFVVGATGRALRVSECPKLLRGSQLGPPLLRLCQIEKVIPGYQETRVSLRNSATAAHTCQEQHNEH